MTRMVQCTKLKREAEGLDYPPYPGDLGVRIWREISKQAWADWTDIQTRLVNENHLNLADARARKYLAQQMESYLFEDRDIEAQGYVPPTD
ncbi:MAG: oxidative damage protection protein [Burkholderiaceae bacterium]